MSEWIQNSLTDTKSKPPQHKEVEILVKGGEVLKASWLKDINKYVRNVNSWHIIGTGNYISDNAVIAWRECDDNNSNSAGHEKEQNG